MTGMEQPEASYGLLTVVCFYNPLWSVSKCLLLLKARQLKVECGESEWKGKQNNLREMQNKFTHTTSFFGFNAVNLSSTIQSLASEQAYFMH